MAATEMGARGGNRNGAGEGGGAEHWSDRSISEEGDDGISVVRVAQMPSPLNLFCGWCSQLWLFGGCFGGSRDSSTLQIMKLKRLCHVTVFEAYDSV